MFVLRWRKQAFSYEILHIKTYPSNFSHSVMLTNTVVFPHVVSLLLNPGGQRGYRNPRLPVKVCCVWCSSGIWFLTPFSTVLYLCPLVPMTPPSPPPPPFRSAYYVWNGNDWRTLFEGQPKTLSIQIHLCQKSYIFAFV